MLNLYDGFPPVVNNCVTRAPAPWMTQEIRALMAQRDSAFREYKKAKFSKSFLIDRLHQKYKSDRNKCTQQIRNYKIKYYCKVDKKQSPGKVDKKQSPVSMWNNLHSKHTESKAIFTPDELNSHFSLQECKPANVMKTELMNEIKSNTRESTDSENKLFFKQILTFEANRAIKHKKSKAKGKDEISIKLVCLIIQPWINSRTFPTCLKNVLVCTLPKMSNPNGLCDYRPISILPCLSKALEYIIHGQIASHINKYNLLDDFQCGFRRQHSICAALINVTEDIRRAMDSRQLTLLTLIDLSKAFDSVDHDILLAKLRSYFNLMD
ncbi:hypothetical protein PR048_019491 [Dryococelus australis]|uniref:Reverse transcriptase domain-containing protein n=1 Tax=Dryococelus australis TaxID=614101 RepID=A0ABQ9H3Q7_9NEOP|nr:hypothetical protein PR048_019491 [Dryococelus australis]